MRFLKSCPSRPRVSAVGAWGLKLCLLVAFLIPVSGCSLGVMLGKMIVGEPMIGDDFKSQTGKSMTDKGNKIAILCSTPESVKDQFASLQVELLSDVSRKMSIHEIDVVKPHLVARWIDDNGGVTEGLGDLAAEVDADYIVDIKVDHFSYREENSPNLFRGRCNGQVIVYEFERDEEDKKDSSDKKASKKKSSKTLHAKLVYQRNFKSTHPANQPVPADQTSELIFRKKFMDRVGDQIARLFYKHRAGVEF